MKKEFYNIEGFTNASIQDNPFRGIEESSSKNKKLSCYVGGGGIGHPKDINKGRQMIFNYLKEKLARHIAEAEYSIKFLKKLDATLGNDWYNLRIYKKEE